MVKNLLLFDLGLTLGLPTILIPVLRGYLRETNPNETLYFTAEQSSWYGKFLLTVSFKYTINNIPQEASVCWRRWCQQCSPDTLPICLVAGTQ